MKQWGDIVSSLCVRVLIDSSLISQNVHWWWSSSSQAGLNGRLQIGGHSVAWSWRNLTAKLIRQARRTSPNFFATKIIIPKLESAMISSFFCSHSLVLSLAIHSFFSSNSKIPVNEFARQICLRLKRCSDSKTKARTQAIIGHFSLSQLAQTADRYQPGLGDPRCVIRSCWQHTHTEISSTFKSLTNRLANCLAIWLEAGQTDCSPISKQVVPSNQLLASDALRTHTVRDSKRRSTMSLVCHTVCEWLWNPQCGCIV